MKKGASEIKTSETPSIKELSGVVVRFNTPRNSQSDVVLHCQPDKKESARALAEQVRVLTNNYSIKGGIKNDLK